MNKRVFLDTLKEMKGKAFVYANKTYQIMDYSIDDHRGYVTVKTDKRTFEKSYDSVSEFLTYFSPVIETEAEELSPEVHRPASVPPDQAMVQSNAAFEEQNTLMKDLIAVLKDNIEKVKNNKDYIPQAQAINNNVNSIVNVTKLQLDVYKQFKGKRSPGT